MKLTTTTQVSVDGVMQVDSQPWSKLHGPVSMEGSRWARLSTLLTSASTASSKSRKRGPRPAASARKGTESGGDISQFGFGRVSHTLMAAGLLDRLRLWVHPFIIGRGGPKDLLYRDAPAKEFSLVNAITLKSGIVILDYHARRNGSEH